MAAAPVPKHARPTVRDALLGLLLSGGLLRADSTRAEQSTTPNGKHTYLHAWGWEENGVVGLVGANSRLLRVLRRTPQPTTPIRKHTPRAYLRTAPSTTLAPNPIASTMATARIRRRPPPRRNSTFTPAPNRTTSTMAAASFQKHTRAACICSPRPSWRLPCKYPLSQDHADQILADCFPTFRKELLPPRFSCNWRNSYCLRIFIIPPKWHNLSPIGCIITHTFEIPGQIRPLAFCYSTDPVVLVSVGAEYVLWDDKDQTLTRYGSDFASDEDFLARTPLPRSQGTVHQLPLNHDDVLCRVDAEQRRLVYTVEGRVVPPDTWPWK
ncbi:hypothetical protein C8J57DRAFT_1588271 [Mycena rebaudengoi]|nr:hypothetical protein C8J57DRAFT_1588271 [Mycena rebaudengoi]